MFDIRELDVKNTYNPNLHDIQESAERTYGEAEAFLEMVENYLTYFINNISKFSKEIIYDKTNAISSLLAECCELYLKALYIYENNIDGNNIDDIWAELKTYSFKSDSNGNLIYLLEKNGEEIFTYLKTDEQNNAVLDSNGKPIYVDKDNNEYSEGKQGKKIKLNGHQLDRLIDKLSLSSYMLLEMRMLSIPMSKSYMYDEISIYDELKQKGIIPSKQHMLKEEYLGWVDQHKKTFEEARYAGEKQHNINLEFLYHLTKQIKAVAHYKIKGVHTFNNDEEIDYSDLNQIAKMLRDLSSEFFHDIKSPVVELENYQLNEDDYNKIPIDNEYLWNLNCYNLFSKELVNLIINDREVKEKLLFILNHNVWILREFDYKNFYNLLYLCDIQEVGYIISLCSKKSFVDEGDENDIIKAFTILNFSVEDIVNYSIALKIKYDCKIDETVFLPLADYMSFVEHYYGKINDEIREDSNKKFSF